MNESASWDKIVTKSIINHKDFKGVDVNNLASLHSIVFKMEDYSTIALLIKANKPGNIKSFEVTTPSDLREYLDIVQFSDENNKLYLATVYDSDAIQQDPEVLDIFYFSK